MKCDLRKKALELRLRNQMSYSEIRKRLKVSKSTLSYWLREHPLSEDQIAALRRQGWQKSQASRERYRNSMRALKEARAQQVYSRAKANFANMSRDAMFTAGLMLYLGEGNKRQESRIGLANTDPTVCRFFVWWLGEFMGVPRKHIRAELHLYENMAILTEEKYWRKQLALPQCQFYKTQVRRLRASSFTYPGSQRHGTCSIYVNDTAKKRDLIASMQALLDVCDEKRV